MLSYVVQCKASKNSKWVNIIEYNTLKDAKEQINKAILYLEKLDEPLINYWHFRIIKKSKRKYLKSVDNQKES